MTLNSLSYLLWGKEEPSESGQLQGLPGTLVSCLLPALMSFCVGLDISIPEEAVKH